MMDIGPHSSADLVAFVATTDLTRARAFYESVLGLRIVEESAFACVCDANGTELRVTLVDAVAPAGYTVLGWRVDDIAASIEALVERGVAFERFDGMSQDSLGIWMSPSGASVAWFKDSDGNTLSLTQPAETTRASVRQAVDV
jgi:catechol 2,3-dioxygenase-like lactoylglutathione lyase family enzyme